MSLHDAQFQYVEGQARPTFAALLARYETMGAAAAGSLPCSLDVRYGAAEREVFDFFPAGGAPLGTLLYFHAGYWQSRDKATFRFIAPAFTQRGLNVALVNYPLCPTVALAGLLASCRAAVPAVQAHAAALGQADHPLLAAGHSAGAHIAVELALTQWPEGAARSPVIDGTIALSGIYDLAPLVTTTLNQKLGLEPASAASHSPLFRVAAGAPPALFAVGGDETPAFLDQSTRMHQAWLAAGNRSALEIVAGTDHFSLLEPFTAPDSALSGQVASLIEQARQRFCDRAQFRGARH